MAAAAMPSDVTRPAHDADSRSPLPASTDDNVAAFTSLVDDFYAAASRGLTSTAFGSLLSSHTSAAGRKNVNPVTTNASSSGNSRTFPATIATAPSRSVLFASSVTRYASPGGSRGSQLLTRSSSSSPGNKSNSRLDDLPEEVLVLMLLHLVETGGSSTASRRAQQLTGSPGSAVRRPSIIESLAAQPGALGTAGSLDDDALAGMGIGGNMPASIHSMDSMSAAGMAVMGGLGFRSRGGLHGGLEDLLVGDGSHQGGGQQGPASGLEGLRAAARFSMCCKRMRGVYRSMLDLRQDLALKVGVKQAVLTWVASACS